MPGYFGALTIVLLMGMVLTRVLMLRRRGITATYFGNLNKTDFLIPPFALFYILSCVRPCIQSPHRKQTGVLPF
jgi:hypothetical protein